MQKRLDRTVQFRSIASTPGRLAQNQTRKISIPLDMLGVLGWEGGQPIEIRLDEDAGTLTLRRVDPDTEGLARKQNGAWDYADRP